MNVPQGSSKRCVSFSSKRQKLVEDDAVFCVNAYLQLPDRALRARCSGASVGGADGRIHVGASLRDIFACQLICEGKTNAEMRVSREPLCRLW